MLFDNIGGYIFGERYVKYLLSIARWFSVVVHWCQLTKMHTAKCTSGWQAGFFLTVIEVQWSSELILLKLFVRPPCVLGTLGLSARGWADLNWFVPAEGGKGDNLHALPEVWPSPLCPSNCQNFNVPLNEVLIRIVIKRDGQFASSVRPGQEIWAG